VLALLLVALVVVPLATAARSVDAKPLRVRAAVPADDSPKSAATQWWQVLAFDPATRTTVQALFVSQPSAYFRVTVIPRGAASTVLGSDGMALVPQSRPGVAMVGTSPLPGREPPRASLAYSRGKYVVEARSGAGSAHLEVVPTRAGPTVGPWKLGPHRTMPANPPAFVPGTRTWSVPVALGSAGGWVEIDGQRLNLRGWRAYHDHTWGQFSLAESNWVHSDFAVVDPRPGEVWIVNGLEPSDGGYRTKPDDRRWQGVLVHAVGRRLSTCTARVHRTGWVAAFSSGWSYFLPSRVDARCAETGSFSFRPEGKLHGLDGFGVGQEVGVNQAAHGGTGWFAHAMPPVPTS